MDAGKTSFSFRPSRQWRESFAQKRKQSQSKEEFLSVGEEEVPIVFLHGIGIGVLPYLSMLDLLVKEVTSETVLPLRHDSVTGQIHYHRAHALHFMPCLQLSPHRRRGFRDCLFNFLYDQSSAKAVSSILRSFDLKDIKKPTFIALSQEDQFMPVPAVENYLALYCKQEQAERARKLLVLYLIHEENCSRQVVVACETHVLDTGTVVNTSSIGFAFKMPGVWSNNNTDPGLRDQSYAVELRGLFKPSSTGRRPFSLYSDDSSLMWVGDTAVTGYRLTNATVNNGRHTLIEVSGSIDLEQGYVYPIRIQY
eukprot:755126-Hanusia_phi.AAC.5